MEEQKGFRLSREISIADIVAVVCIGIPALIWAGKIDTRINQVETLMAADRAATQAVHARLDQDRESLRREIKDDLREINRKLDSLVGRGR